MSTTTTHAPATGSAAAASTKDRQGGKFLTFRLAENEYAIDILAVREIIGVPDITAVPQMPEFVKGVINLRGKVIPVVDLRQRFGLGETQRTEETCIIVIDTGQDTGLIVDAVCEVLDIKGEQIDPPPSMGAAVDTSFIFGLGKVDDQVKILLEIEKVVDFERSSEPPAPATQEETGGPTG